MEKYRKWQLLPHLTCLACAIGIAVTSGCSAITFKIKGIPASTLPQECRAIPKRGMVPIEVTKLAQVPPEKYLLAPGDIIGVSIEGIMPLRSVDGDPTLAPVHFPTGEGNLPPAIGIPVVVQESGSVTLLASEPIPVSGLSLDEAAETIRKAYRAKDIIKSDSDVFPVVTLIRPRMVNVMVIREDTGSVSRTENTMEATGGQIQLAAYKNDVLNALMATGGLPGLRAKNEIRIHRNRRRNAEGATVAGMFGNSVDYRGEYAQRPQASADLMGPEVVIPLRVPAGTQLEIAPEDIILLEGDVVYIANRDTEVFYTAGMLPGGEHLLPRDYDIDILEAMAIAGYSYGTPRGSGGGGGGGMAASTGIAPTQLFVFREREDGTEYTIKIDLERAVADDCERLIVKPGDKLLLRFSPKEETLNFGIFAFFTYGIRQLFQ